MFGITAFSGSPFSSTAGNVYSEAITIAASSSSSCYSIRYAFGGATVVGVSTVDAKTNRYTFVSTSLNGSSSVAAVSNVVLRTGVQISPASEFTAKVVYSALGSATVASNSQFMAIVRKKWENEADISETWTMVQDNSEIWTQVTDNSETWTRTTH